MAINNDDLFSPAKAIQQFCSVCQSDMVEMKCKYVCPNCGSKMDCSDT